MARLSNSAFLEQLAAALAQNNGQSSIYLTQKRLSPSLGLDDEADAAAGGFADLPGNVVGGGGNTRTYAVLVRVSTNGGGSSAAAKAKLKLKLSTVVETDALDQFWGDYDNALKNGFVGLRKKEKKKAKKGRVGK